MQCENSLLLLEDGRAVLSEAGVLAFIRFRASQLQPAQVLPRPGGQVEVKPFAINPASTADIRYGPPGAAVPP